MRSDIRQLVIALVVMAAAAVPLYRVVAYDINDIVEVRINDQTADLVCKSRTVLDGLERIKQGYLKQLVQDTLNEFKDNAVAFAFQLVLCNTIPDKTVNVGAFGFGGQVTFKSPQCNWDIGGMVSATLKRNFLDKVKNDFTARCIADGARKKVTDDIRRIIQENGPDGGPAYVTDWVGLYANEDTRAINRFNAILVNTDICPYFRDRALAHFGVPRSYIDNPPALTGLDRIDGEAPFNLQASCTMGAGFDPERLNTDFTGAGGFDAIRAMLEPQNNYDGFIAMAEAERASQRATLIAAAEAEAIAGGGFRSAYGPAEESCINRDPNGNCLALGPVKQPAGGLRDANAATIQAEYDWINTSKEMNTLLGDVRARLASLVLDIDSEPLGYDLEFDASTQDYEDIGAGIRPPDNASLSPIPGPGGSGGGSGGNNPNDPACTGGNPLCICVRNSPEFAFLSAQIGEATRAAIVQHPELVTPDGNSVLPGQNRTFLDAVCATSFGSALGCHINGDSEDEVVVDAGTLTVSLDLITADGVIRIPGQTVAACQIGVQ